MHGEGELIMKIGQYTIHQSGSIGMPILHMQAIKKVAIEHNIVIAVRPVNKLASFFINQGCPSKPYHVKNKSTTLGIAAGLIAINPYYSQTSESEFKHYTSLLNDAFNADKDLIATPCILPKSRFQELKKYFADEMHIQTTTDPNTLKISWKKENKTIYVLAEKNGNDDNYTILSENGEKLQVLGKKIHLNGNDLIMPITSDYDLLVLCPAYKDYNPDGKDKNPSSINEATHPIQAGIKAQLPPYHFGIQEDAKGGNWSRRTKDMVSGINAAIMAIDTKRRGINLEMVHHNIELDNPAFTGNNIFPCLIFLPQEMDFKENVLMLESQQELKKAFDLLHQNKYYWPEHPKLPDLKAPKLEHHTHNNRYFCLEDCHTKEVKSIL
jgi:hypothetical protein